MAIRFTEDYSLVDKYLNGDKEAGIKLYGQIYSFVMKHINSRVNGSILNEEDKEDLLSEVFETSILKMVNYDGSCKFSTFVISIAENKIKEKFRYKSKIGQKEETLDSVVGIYDNIEDYYNRNPLNIVIENEKMAALIKARNLLNTDYQNIIKLKLCDKKTKEIATLIGKTEEAVDSMYRRAIKAWKMSFEKVYNNCDGKS